MLPEYQQFVLSKEAPPATIPAHNSRLLHVALGIATELLELDLSTTRDNTLEELGDFLWYLTLGSDVLNVPLVDLPLKMDISPHSNHLSLVLLKEDAELFVSLVKKQVIYGSPVMEEILACYLSLWSSFVYHAAFCSTDIGYLVSTNQAKLEARYKASFTTQESEERRDKQDGKAT